MDDGTLLREVYCVKFLNFAPSLQPYDLSNGLCYPTFEQLELEFLFNSGHSYSQYGIILLISSYLFFIFAGISTWSWKYSVYYQTPGVTLQKKRLGINRLHKSHGNSGKSLSIHVTKKEHTLPKYKYIPANNHGYPWQKQHKDTTCKVKSKAR